MPQNFMAFDSHKTTIGKALKNLEEKGYICRTINPDDRREKKVSLSEYGMNKFAEVLRIQKEWETVLETKLTKEESNDFNRICRILCDEARKMVEHDHVFTRPDNAAFGHLHDAVERFSGVARIEDYCLPAAHIVDRLADFPDRVVVGAEVIVARAVKVARLSRYAEAVIIFHPVEILFGKFLQSARFRADADTCDAERKLFIPDADLQTHICAHDQRSDLVPRCSDHVFFCR